MEAPESKPCSTVLLGTYRSPAESSSRSQVRARGALTILAESNEATVLGAREWSQECFTLPIFQNFFETNHTSHYPPGTCKGPAAQERGGGRPNYCRFYCRLGPVSCRIRVWGIRQIVLNVALFEVSCHRSNSPSCA